MGQGVIAILSVVIADPGCSYSSVRHGFNKQKDIGLVYSASSEGKRLQKAVDCFLVPAEHVAGERLWHRLNLRDQRTKVGISEDGQKRSEDFVLHDFVGPGNRVEDGWIEIARRSVGLSTVNNLLGIDQCCKSFNSACADYA